MAKGRFLEGQQYSIELVNYAPAVEQFTFGRLVAGVWYDNAEFSKGNFIVVVNRGTKNQRGVMVSPDIVEAATLPDGREVA